MKPTQKTPTKVDRLSQPGGPKAGAKPAPKGAAGSKLKRPGANAQAKNKGQQPIYKNPIALAAGGLVAVLILGMLAYLLITPSKPEVVENQPPTADEFAIDQPVEPIYPADHFMVSPAPIQTLADQVANKAILQHQGYMMGQGLTLPTGEVLMENSPELLSIKDQIATTVALDLANKTQETVDPSTGRPIVMVLDPGTGNYNPVDSEMAAAALESQALNIANTKIETVLLQRQQTQQYQENVLSGANQPEVMEKKVVVESVLSDEEKRKYLDLIDTQDRENKKLRAELADMQDSMLEQRKQVINVMQKIEDSPNVNKRLTASMLPKSSGLKTMGISGDRVWFEDANGKLITHSIGEVIDGTDLVISGTDEGANIVMVTKK